MFPLSVKMICGIKRVKVSEEVKGENVRFEDSARSCAQSCIFGVRGVVRLVDSYLARTIK